MRIVHFRDLPVIPWRNGGGVTRETAVHHDPLLHPDFLWRVSMATVNAPGPFSRFDGIDRTIAVLDGAGIVLTIGGREQALTPTSPPFAFNGETAVGAAIIEGGTTDLNVMTRRGHFSHTMERIVVDGTIELVAEAVATILVFMRPTTVSARSHAPIAAEPLDTLIDIGPGTRLKLAADAPVEIVAIRIRA